jgi:hypothetical protein
MTVMMGRVRNFIGSPRWLVWYLRNRLPPLSGRRGMMKRAPVTQREHLLKKNPVALTYNLSQGAGSVWPRCSAWCPCNCPSYHLHACQHRWAAAMRPQIECRCEGVLRACGTGDAGGGNANVAALERPFARYCSSTKVMPAPVWPSLLAPPTCVGFYVKLGEMPRRCPGLFRSAPSPVPETGGMAVFNGHSIGSIHEHGGVHPTGQQYCQSLTSSKETRPPPLDTFCTNW